MNYFLINTILLDTYIHEEEFKGEINPMVYLKPYDEVSEQIVKLHAEQLAIGKDILIVYVVTWK